MKILCIVLTAILAVSTLSSCNKTNEKDSSETAGTNYTFLDDNAETEKFIENDDGSFTSADGAFTVELEKKPELSDDEIIFTFCYKNNTDYDLNIDFSPECTSCINDIPEPPTIIDLESVSGPRTTLTVKAGQTIKENVRKPLKDTSWDETKGQKSYWNFDADNKVELEYSFSIYVRMSDEMMGEKRAYDNEDEIDIKYFSDKTTFFCTLDKDGNIIE